MVSLGCSHCSVCVGGVRKGRDGSAIVGLCCVEEVRVRFWNGSDGCKGSTWSCFAMLPMCCVVLNDGGIMFFGAF